MEKRRTINLNDPNAFTLKNLRVMLAEADDTVANQIRVTKAGVAYVSPEPDVGNVNTEDLAFRLETMLPGNDYIGFHAARDDAYAQDIYDVLRANWPNPSDDYIDSW